MISEILSAESFFWTCIWQSTIFITAGLIGSFIFRYRSARAYQMLLLAMIAVVIVPVLSQLVKHYELGLFSAEHTVLQSQSEYQTTKSDTATNKITLYENIENKPSADENDLASAITTSESTKFLYRSVMLYGWLAASLILTARLFITFILGIRLLERAKPLNCDRIEQAIHLAKAKLRMNKDIMVYGSDVVRSPVIWCWRRRPVLLVPTATRQSDTKINWAGVLCHELAHYKRRDHISGLLAELVVCIMPWHPLLWWAKSRLIRLSEQACDDWVVATGQSCTDYAESLLDLTPCGQMAFVPAVVSSKRGLAGRIQHILKNNRPNPQTGVVWALTVTIVAVCLTFGVALAQTRPNRIKSREVVELQLRDAHVIHFPKDRLMGTVYIRDIEPDNWYENWQKLNEATGDIAIPQNKEVKLEIDEEAAKDLSPLSTLRPDDLQMLSFGWKPVKINSLAPIGNLRGLKALNLQTAKFNSEDFKYLTELLQLEVLRLGDQQLTDGTMKYIGKLTSLRSLALWGTGISDEGLKNLRTLTNLTFLALNNCKITDEGLTYLENMTVLEGLQLSQTKITDKGLAKLKNFTRLKSLLIGYTNITDAGLEHLQTLTSLEIIWINSTPITDKGIAYFRNMKNLKSLFASRTKITNAGLAHLKGLRKFKHLNISGIGNDGIQHLSKLSALEKVQILDAQVTKASIPYFNKMKSIKEILLSGDKINDDMLNELRTALPSCKIWDPQRSRDYPMAAWRQRFEAVYRLEDDQILKRISPPFIPERRDYYLNEHSSQASRISRSPDRFIFHWIGKLKKWGLGFVNTNINSALYSVLRLNTFEYDVPEELQSLKMPGDWIVRDEFSKEAKLKALEQLLANELGRNIRFEKRTVEREVIIAKGKFKFHPPSGTYESSSVHLFCDQVDPDEGAGGGTAHSVNDFLQRLGSRVKMPVIDKTESSEQLRIPYRHHRSSMLRNVKDKVEKNRKLKMLLISLTEQTELQFAVERRPVEIWFATEDKEN